MNESPTAEQINTAIKHVVRAVASSMGVSADAKLASRPVVRAVLATACPNDTPRQMDLKCNRLKEYLGRRGDAAVRESDSLRWIFLAAIRSSCPEVEDAILLSKLPAVMKSFQADTAQSQELSAWLKASRKTRSLPRSSSSPPECPSRTWLGSHSDIFPSELWARPRIMLQLASWAHCEAKHQAAIREWLPVLAQHLIASPWNFMHCGRANVIAHDLLLAMIKGMGPDAAKERVYSIVSEKERGNEKEYVGPFVVLGTRVLIGEYPIDRYPAVTDATTAVLAVAGSTGTTELLNRSSKRRLPIVALPQFGGRAARYTDPVHSRAIGRGATEYRESLRRLHGAKEPSALAEWTVRCLRHAIDRSPQLARPD